MNVGEASCFVSKALVQCVNNMSVKLVYFLFKGWIAISTGDVIIQQVSICWGTQMYPADRDLI